MIPGSAAAHYYRWNDALERSLNEAHYVRDTLSLKELFIAMIKNIKKGVVFLSNVFVDAKKLEHKLLNSHMRANAI